MSALAVVLEEVLLKGALTVRWHCEPPPPGAWFRIVRQEWNEDYSVRDIYEVRLRGGVEYTVRYLKPGEP